MHDATAYRCAVQSYLAECPCAVTIAPAVVDEALQLIDWPDDTDREHCDADRTEHDQRRGGATFARIETFHFAATDADLEVVVRCVAEFHGCCLTAGGIDADGLTVVHLDRCLTTFGQDGENEKWEEDADPSPFELWQATQRRIVRQSVGAVNEVDLLRGYGGKVVAS